MYNNNSAPVERDSVYRMSHSVLYGLKYMLYYIQAHNRYIAYALGIKCRYINIYAIGGGGFKKKKKRKKKINRSEKNTNDK